MIELGAWINSSRQQLADFSDTPGLEAEILLAHVLGQSRTWVAAHPEASLDGEAIDRLDRMLERLLSGEPLPYLLGHWEFFGLDFYVSPAVLIPRPETELLVEAALGWLKAHPYRRRAIDVGTGSGCIAISLATALSDLDLYATDISFKALQVAQINVGRMQVNPRLQLIQTDLLRSLQGPFDLIIANLPYIPWKKLDGLKVTQNEPRLALDGGQDGLRLITSLLQLSPSRLAKPGCILLEIEFEQGENASAIARQIFPQASINVLPDLAGLSRILKIETYEN